MKLKASFGKDLSRVLYKPSMNINLFSTLVTCSKYLKGFFSEKVVFFNKTILLIEACLFQLISSYKVERT